MDCDSWVSREHGLQWSSKFGSHVYTARWKRVGTGYGRPVYRQIWNSRGGPVVPVAELQWKLGLLPWERYKCPTVIPLRCNQGVRSCFVVLQIRWWTASSTPCSHAVVWPAWKWWVWFWTRSQWKVLGICAGREAVDIWSSTAAGHRMGYPLLPRQEGHPDWSRVLSVAKWQAAIEISVPLRSSSVILDRNPWIAYSPEHKRFDRVYQSSKIKNWERAGSNHPSLPPVFDPIPRECGPVRPFFKTVAIVHSRSQTPLKQKKKPWNFWQI